MDKKTIRYRVRRKSESYNMTANPLLLNRGPQDRTLVS